MGGGGRGTREEAGEGLGGGGRPRASGWTGGGKKTRLIPAAHEEGEVDDISKWFEIQESDS